MCRPDTLREIERDSCVHRVFLHPQARIVAGAADGPLLAYVVAAVKHYTQQPSELRSSAESRLLEVRGGGFVTRQMVRETISGWRDDALPSGVLVDLREVAGYESGCATLAHRWLIDAHQRGVQRIAFVASSSVLRTATRLVSSSAAVDLKIFEDDVPARRWLETGGLTARRHEAAMRPRV